MNENINTMTPAGILEHVTSDKIDNLSITELKDLVVFLAKNYNYVSELNKKLYKLP